MTRPPVPTPNGAVPRVRPTGKSDAVWSATSPASSTDSWRPTHALTQHRSVQRDVPAALRRDLPIGAFPVMASGRIMGPLPAVDLRRRPMAVPLSLGPVHHLRLTVTDVQRSRVFYTELLGFQIAMDAPPPASDRFDPFRCGLDHLSFGVANRAELEAALQAFEERGVEHSDITDLPPFGIAVLPFKDPDGLALELTAPL